MPTAALIGRIGWTAIVIVVVESMVCGLAALPVVAFWIWLTAALPPAETSARLGRGAYVNTTSISDHDLLEFGDGVVIGADVHISGHTSKMAS